MQIVNTVYDLHTQSTCVLKPPTASLCPLSKHAALPIRSRRVQLDSAVSASIGFELPAALSTPFD